MKHVLMRGKYVCTIFKDRDISPEVIITLYSEMQFRQIVYSAETLSSLGSFHGYGKIPSKCHPSKFPTYLNDAFARMF